jgi:hypothetical protein
MVLKTGRPLDRMESNLDPTCSFNADIDIVLQRYSNFHSVTYYIEEITRILQLDLGLRKRNFKTFVYDEILI